MAAYLRLADNYYNEFDENAAAWLRELIRRGLIAPGDVDTRSIVDVRPDDLTGYNQCHFFAGIGVWSYALRVAEWPDDRPVWTGSPPCQPFSAAGKGLGTADERHLWPAFFHLVDVGRPDTFFGEQVASKDALAWLDHVSADVEGAGYAFGAFDLCAAGFGAPHIRQRLKFVGTRTLADGVSQGLEGHRRHGDDSDQPGWVGTIPRRPVAEDCPSSGLALPDDAFWRANLSRGNDGLWDDAGRTEDAGDARLGGGSRGMAYDTSGRRREERADVGRIASGDRAQGLAAGSVDGGSSEWLADAQDGDGGRRECREEAGTGTDGVRWRGSASGSDVERLADADGRQHGERDLQLRGQLGLQSEDGGGLRAGHSGSWLGSGPELERPGPTNGLWGDVDWLLCRDGKWRPVEPGTFPLAHGAPARVGRLRGYGNAIVAPAAAHFIAAFLDAEAGDFDCGADLASGGLIEDEEVDLLA